LAALFARKQHIGSGGGYGSYQHSSGSYLGFGRLLPVKRENQPT